MNKLLLAVSVCILGLGAASPSVSALDCSISDTGPDSTNECTSIENFRCTVNNDNQVVVYNDNNQVVDTGDAVTVTNTSGGSSTSGDATNTNETVVEGTIKNNSCVIAAAPVVTPPTTVMPSGGQGEVVTPVPAPAGRGAVTALPNTGTESAIGIIAGLVTLLGATVAGSRLAVSAYGNLKS
jgi:LPXTG-motif cell wall-anchored protein